MSCHPAEALLLCVQPTTFYNNLLEGRSGVATIQGFDTEGWTTNFGGEIRVSLPEISLRSA